MRRPSIACIHSRRSSRIPAGEGGSNSAPPHELLGVCRGASLDELRMAFNAKAREHHPDTSSDPDAAAAFQQVHEAYVSLKQQQQQNSAAAAAAAAAPAAAAGSTPAAVDFKSLFAPRGPNGDTAGSSATITNLRSSGTAQQAVVDQRYDPDAWAYSPKWRGPLAELYKDHETVTAGGGAVVTDDVLQAARRTKPSFNNSHLSRRPGGRRR
eukprot:SAG22_NODE_4925_length_1130_cov_0.990301_2_plen_211_part_00